MKSAAMIVVPSLLLIGSATSQQPKSEPTSQQEGAQLVQHLMSIEAGFEEMVPPGTSIRAKEVSRKGTVGKDLVVRYHIFVNGFPPSTLFRCLQWPANADKPSITLEGITAGKEGLLMCAGRAPEQCGDPKKPDDPIEFTIMPLKGEPSRFAFIASDSGAKIGTVIVPVPIEAKDNGCTLNAVRLTSRFELAFISGEGYPPKTEVHFKVTSEEMSNDFVIKSDEHGVIRTGVVPYHAKKGKGVARVKVVESKCSPEVAFEWGVL